MYFLSYLCIITRRIFIGLRTLACPAIWLSMFGLFFFALSAQALVPVATQPIRWDTQASAYDVSVASLNITSPAQSKKIPTGATAICMVAVENGEPHPAGFGWYKQACVVVNASDTWAKAYQTFLDRFLGGFTRVWIPGNYNTDPPVAQWCFEPAALIDEFQGPVILGPDVVCTHPHPSDVTCTYSGTSNLTLDFGTVSTGNDQRVAENISIQCSGATDVEIELSGENSVVAMENNNGDKINSPITFDGDKFPPDGLLTSLPAGNTKHSIEATLPVGQFPAGEYSGIAVMLLNVL